jgi:signal transduction histidine kinase
MKLAQRVLLGAVLIVSVPVIVAVVLSGERLRGRLRDLTATQLAREALLVAQQWRSGGGDPDALADSAGAALGHRVTLIDSSGIVLGDSEFSGAALRALANHNDRPEVISARHTAVGRARRVSSSEGIEEMYVAVTATGGKVARVAINMSEIDAISAAAQRDVLLSGLIALLVAFALATVFSRQVNRPVAELGQVAIAIARRDFTRPPSTKAPGEAGELAGAVQLMGEKLDQLEVVRRDFVANVSHELKTPLTAIRGYAETLSAELPDGAPHATFAATIRNNAERMQRLIDDLLDLSKIESGGWRPSPLPLDIGSEASDIIAQYRDAAAKVGSSFRIEIAPDAAIVRADPTALRQILSNLIENALRYTPRGGTITIFARPDDQSVMLGVRDTGSGIPSEHLPRIFERFYRADPARSRAAGGTGLGLSIVKHLVEAHGGRAFARSTVGAGTTVWMLFPDVA